MRPPILVTGAARSGTSMTAGVLVYSGAKGGDMFGPTRHNPRGMFENQMIREGLVKPYLRSIGADPMGQNPLPDMDRVHASAKDPAWVARWRGHIEGIMRVQGVGEDDAWCYKGAKMCLFWPVWAAAFPDAKWVLVRRTPADIVSSCMRTGFMRAYRTREGWEKWLSVHFDRFCEMRQALSLLEVWPEKVIGGAAEIYYNMAMWAGLRPPEGFIENFVDPVLWGRRK